MSRYVRNPSSLQHALNVYVWALTSQADQVREAFAGRRLTKAQFAAALSFHWNTGGIKRAFMSWRKPPEIVGRRKKERDLFFKGQWSNAGTVTEFTRVTSRLTPDWSSGRRINVEMELNQAFATAVTPTLDQSPKPDKVPAAPTLSPQPPQGVPAPTPQPDPKPSPPAKPELPPGGGGIAKSIAKWWRTLLFHVGLLSILGRKGRTKLNRERRPLCRLGYASRTQR